MTFFAGDIICEYSISPEGHMLILYGLVEQATPKSFVVRWGNGLSRRHRQGTDKYDRPHHVPDDVRRALATP